MGWEIRYFSYIYTEILKKTAATFSLRTPCVLFVVHWLTDSTIQHLYADDVKVNKIWATPTNR